MIVAGFIGFAALGTVARWALGIRLPPLVGTLAVNLTGSFGLGLLAGHSADSQMLLGVAGFGAFTTFSTVMVELTEFWRERPGWTIAYGVTTLTGGVGLAWLGLVLA